MSKGQQYPTVKVESFDPGQAPFIDQLDVDSEPFVHLPLEEYAGQDPNDPVWASLPLDPAVKDEQGSDGSGHDPGLSGVRTNSGHLDMLQEVVQEGVDALIDRETTHGEAHHHKQGPPDPLTVVVFDRAAKYMRAVTYTVGTQNYPNVHLTERKFRKRAVITNLSSAVLLVSHETPGGPGGSSAGNVVTVAANGGVREFRSEAEMWVWALVPGTPQVFDVQDEYGIPEQ